jgi:hypothetical protein
MEDSERDEELYRRWWMRMRRAFGIADLITDGHARFALVEVIDKGGTIQNITNQRGTIESLVDRILDLASRGALDHFIIRAEYRTHMESAEGAVSIADLVRGALGVPDSQPSDEPNRKLEAIAQGIIDWMAADILEKPFEDGHGGYFDGAYPPDFSFDWLPR